MGIYDNFFSFAGKYPEKRHPSILISGWKVLKTLFLTLIAQAVPRDGGVMYPFHKWNLLSGQIKMGHLGYNVIC